VRRAKDFYPSFGRKLYSRFWNGLMLRASGGKVTCTRLVLMPGQFFVSCAGMKEYPISRANFIAGFVFGALFFVGGIILLFAGGLASTHGGQIAGFVLGVLLAPLGLYLFRECTRLRVTIDDHQLTVQHAFSSQSMALTDIDGYLIGDKESCYLIASGDEKSLRVPKGLADRSDLLDWIKEKYEDIDARECEAEKAALLENEEFGVSRHEREAMLKRAGRISIIFYLVNLALLLWVLAYPRPFELLMILVLTSPWAGVYFTWKYKGLLRLSRRKSSPYPSVVVGMTLPVIGAALRVIASYDLYGFPASALKTLLAGSLLVTVAGTVMMKEALSAEKRKILAVIVIFIIASAYFFGVLVFSNCHYDHSSPTVLQVGVNGKHESHGRSSTYYLELSPWGKYRNGTSVQVGRSFYDAVASGDSIFVGLYEGKWKIPWYRIGRPN
jgi:hypothetical protein